MTVFSLRRGMKLIGELEKSHNCLSFRSVARCHDGASEFPSAGRSSSSATLGDPSGHGDRSRDVERF